MPEKIEITLEQRLFFTAIFLAVGGMVLGTLLVPVFDIKLAININHTFINILPDSFDFLKSTSEDLLNFQVGQIISKNFTLIILIMCCFYHFTYVITTYKKRTLLKTALLILVMYCGLYLTGFYLTAILSFLTGLGQ
ncbi:hypothetical protein ACTFQF_00265 [Aliivibrio fischeri]|uniref:hypothetical protein n=1 Tax=Aliivibrio fischeri TaxID=668 RepID=UPI000B06DE10|nr:hypothetical protein [Aliivibrio fischeri]